MTRKSDVAAATEAHMYHSYHTPSNFTYRQPFNEIDVGHFSDHILIG